MKIAVLLSVGMLALAATSSAHYLHHPMFYHSMKPVYYMAPVHYEHPRMMMDPRMGYRTDHRMGHRTDYHTDHRTNYRTNHRIDPRMEHSMGQLMDSSMDHQMHKYMPIHNEQPQGRRESEGLDPFAVSAGVLGFLSSTTPIGWTISALKLASSLQ